MGKKTVKNDKTARQTPVLTLREKEIFKRLLDGATPKEIAYSLNVTYPTIAFHEKNLFCKLGVHNINELLTQYSRGQPGQNSGDTDGKIAGVFIRWVTYADTIGSHSNIVSNVEHIQEQYHTTYNFSGVLCPNGLGYTGVIADPDSQTLEAMKKMATFSFKVIGDGNTYTILVTTADTRAKGENNHYHTIFTTKKYEIATVTVHLDELEQSPLFGKPVPFIRDNIQCIQFQPYSTGNFELKIWDIRINTKSPLPVNL